VSVGERERATLARVVETFCPGAPSRAVADTIVAELEAVDRPKLVADLVLFLRVIERRTANLVLAGRPRPFSAMTRHERESYLISWGESALPPRRAAFQAAKRLSLFVAYSRSDGAANPLWAGTGYAPPALDPPAQPMLSARAVSAGEVIAADAVVVGSGAGGGVAAAELAAAGRHVLVLEQGALATEDEFEGREDRGAAGLFWDRQLLTTEDLAISVFAGRTVGGGTVVNWNTSLRLPEDVREEWTRAGLDGMGSALDEHYDAVESRLDIDTEESERNAQNAVLAEGLDALGIPWRVIPRNVAGCGDCGHCGYGCRRGAKQSTMRTYLADALAATRTGSRSPTGPPPASRRRAPTARASPCARRSWSSRAAPSGRPRSSSARALVDRRSGAPSTSTPFPRCSASTSDPSGPGRACRSRS